jgi:hypothetical protein
MEQTVQEPKFDIAILLATRGRTDSLSRSIRSLVDLADNIKGVQIMFAFDKDDSVGPSHFLTDIKPMLDQAGVSYTAMTFEPMGYVNLHKYNNAMAARTDSKWLVIWNDDAVMETQGWDSQIMNYGGQFKLLAFRTHNLHPYSIFPIVPRKWYDLLGYISPHPTQDGWVSQQAYLLDIYERIEVEVLHDRYDLTGNNGDETFRNRPMLEGKPDDPNDFHSTKMIDLRHRDAAKLATWLRSQGVSVAFFEAVFAGTQDPWEKLAKNDVNRLMVQFENPHKHFIGIK